MSISLPKNSVYVTEPYNVLVLSGGAFKGLILLGSLQAIFDRKLNRNFNTFVGTSSGAIICYLLCIGYTPIEILCDVCTNLDIKKVHVNIANVLSGIGVTSYSVIQQQLERLSIEKIGYLPTLNDIRKKMGKTLVVITYNYTKKREEVLSPDTHPDLPCLVALRKSSNLPIIFDHFKYNNCFYVDGGFTNNFPIDVGERFGSNVLGIYLEQNDEKETREIPKNILVYLYQLVLVPVYDAIGRKIDHARSNTGIIRLGHSTSSLAIPVTTHDKLDMFDHGYSSTVKILDDASNNVPASID